MGLATAAALVVAFVLRWRLAGPFLGEPPVPGRPWLTGSDGFAHAHRIRRLVEAFPVPVWRDPFLFHPEGTINEWPLGFDWPLALLLRGITALGVSLDDALLALPFVPLALGLGTVLAFHGLARRWLDPWTAPAATLAFGANAAYLHVSRPGALDHHVVEPLAVVLLLGLPGALARDRQVPALALGLAALAWTSTLLALLLAGTLGLMALVALARGRAADAGVERFARWHLPALLLPCALEAFARAAPVSFATLSFVPWVAAAGALGLWLLVGRVPRPALIAALVVLLPLALLLLPGGLSFASGVVRGTNPFLQRVGEARALFLGPEGPTLRVAHASFGLAYALFPLAFLALRRRVGSSGGPEPAALGLGLVLFLVAFAQQRFAVLFVPALLLLTLRAFLPRDGVRLRGRRALVLAGLALVLLEPPLRFAWREGDPVSPAMRRAVAVAVAVRAAGVPEGLGVAAPPNMGSALNFVADVPAVTSTFFYPRYLVRDYTLRFHERTEDLVRELRAERIGVLVAADDGRYGSLLLEAFGTAGAPVDAGATPAFRPEVDMERFELLGMEPCNALWRRFAHWRLACAPESAPGLTLLGEQRFGADAGQWVRRAVLYRVEP